MGRWSTLNKKDLKQKRSRRVCLAGKNRSVRQEMHGRGVRGWGKHLSRVKRWKEVLWEAQTLERSA